MPELTRMSESQSRKAKKLVRCLCANCDKGNCLLLDDGELCVCPQLISYSVLCSYFRVAVLPADRELYAEIMRTDARKRCPDCGQRFIPPHHNTVYCAACAAKRTRLKKRLWAQRARGRP